MPRLGATLRRVLPCCALLALAGCTYFWPLPAPTDLNTRLAAFPTEDLPLEGRTTIYWDRHQIPFVEAERDADAAFALGLVHAHLRLGQMELARIIARGRLSEYLGSATLDLDKAVRTLDFDRAVPAIEAGLPDDTRLWLQAFVDGVNHYQATARRLPQEFKVLGLERRPWTIGDLLTIARLAGSDANWMLWLTLASLRDREDWPELWADLLETGSSARATFEGMELDDLGEVLGGYRHSGSNALAVAPFRSREGAALLAADPHVGYIAPTIWLLAGVKSPSYHVVGVMPSGFPYFALGRNPSAAWGGTNLYALSSGFYDVSAVDAEEIAVRQEPLKVDGAKEVTFAVRETRWGPIVTDLPQFDELGLPDTALRWMGHLPSDETSAMLAANRATSFAEFRQAFATFAVSGMNMLYADVNGDIGQVQAVRLPRRPNEVPKDIVSRPEAVESNWDSFVDATSLPALLNPEAGYLASANNRPPPGEVPVGVFFSTNDRVERIGEILGRDGEIGLAELKALQQDVYMASSVELRDAFLVRIEELGVAGSADRRERALLRDLAAWDGNYDADSSGALAFELLRRGFLRAYYSETFSGSEDLSGVTDVVGGEYRVLADLREDDPAALRPALDAALAWAAREAAKWPDWGAVHRLELVHPFAAIPLVGETYRFGNRPVGGSVQTLAKSGHRPGGDDFLPTHGATARFLADLSDLDSNYAVLVGGQDGWLNSATFLDQMPLFLAGQYIRMPLRPETARRGAAWVMELKE